MSELAHYCGHNGCACSTDMVNYCPVLTGTLERREKGRGELYHSIDVMSQILDPLMPRDDWFIISGGAVSLYQKEITGEIERVPTDIDIVTRHSGKADGFERLASIYEALQASGISADLITHNREHHGFVFTNPIVEAEIERGVPVDILATMTTTYPDTDATVPSLRGTTLNYPLTDEVFDSTSLVETPSGTIQIASPAFIAFYKMTMCRNGKGKQDNADMCRMAQLGLFDDVDGLVENIDHLSRHNGAVRDEVLSRLFTVTNLIKTI